jgi:hypothetical protein
MKSLQFHLPLARICNPCYHKNTGNANTCKRWLKIKITLLINYQHNVENCLITAQTNIKTLFAKSIINAT